MEQITITMPVSIPPEVVKNILEGNMKTNSTHRCAVVYKALEENEHVYNVYSSDGPMAFYEVGVTAALLLNHYEK